jgi:hypothetical protein
MKTSIVATLCLAALSGIIGAQPAVAGGGMPKLDGPHLGMPKMGVFPMPKIGMPKIATPRLGMPKGGAPFHTKAGDPTKYGGIHSGAGAPKAAGIFNRKDKVTDKHPAGGEPKAFADANKKEKAGDGRIKEKSGTNLGQPKEKATEAPKKGKKI